MEIANKSFRTISNKGGISIALGLFDSVHTAHQTIIKTAKDKARELDLTCAVLTFSLTNERNAIKPLNKKDTKMILCDKDRLEKFEIYGAEIAYIPEFYEIKNLSPEDFFFDILIKKCKVKAITCGYDYHFGSGGIGNTALLEKLCSNSKTDLTIIQQQKLHGEIVSSTFIRELLATGCIAKANEFLGYNYTTKLEVVQGKQIGRELGFNTANQVLDESLTIPRYGGVQNDYNTKGSTISVDHLNRSETYL